MELDASLKAAFDAGRRLPTAVEAPAPDGTQLIMRPKDWETERLPPLMPALAKGAPVFFDQLSFIEYVNLFKTPATRIFGLPAFLSPGGEAGVVAVLDYHSPEQPQNGYHRATYMPRHSDQWKRWQDLNGATLKQAEFAEIIEEVRGDINVPSAAELMDVVRAFKASRKVDFDSVVYQPNGDLVLGYSDKTEQTGSSGRLPEVLDLGLPVYFRGATFRVHCFVRYKVSGGAVNFTLKLDRPDRIEDEAFRDILTAVAEQTGIEPYLGKP